MHEVITEVMSGKDDERPEFGRARRLAKELKGVLVAAEASRFSRGSTTHVLYLYEQAAKDGYCLYALDLPEIDITSPSGELMLTLLAAINRFERRMIAQRTSRAMRAKAARGEPVGRPRQYEPEVIDKMRDLRADGMSYHEIADQMNSMGIPNLSGGQWDKQRVYDTLKRYGHVPPKVEDPIHTPITASYGLMQAVREMGQERSD